MQKTNPDEQLKQADLFEAPAAPQERFTRTLLAPFERTMDQVLAERQRERPAPGGAGFIP
jgi:hypothetical protein